MSGYRLSRRAEDDVDGILEYSLLQWGEAKADEYVAGLHALFEEIALYPQRGLESLRLQPGLRRWLYQSHAVFYRKKKDEILIVRVLHVRMDVPRHL